MKSFLEVIKCNVDDIVTASGVCEYEDCPSLEWDEQAIEG